MKVHGRIISAVLLISVCAPAVQADLIADPNEFKQLKKLTGIDRQNKRDGKNVNVAPKLNEEKKQAAEKTTDKTVKVNAKASAKANDKPNVRSKGNSATTASGEKAK